MSPEDTEQVKNMIQGSVTAAVAALGKQQQARSAAEVGSPEFAEDRTQINSLNNKWIFAKEVFSEDTLRREGQQLFSAAYQSLMESVNLSKQLHNKFFERTDDRAEVTRGWNYATMYDVSNPVAVGSGANITAGAVPANRGIDAATVQSVLNNTTVQDAINAAVANAVNGTIPTLEASVGAAVAAALANTPIKPSPSSGSGAAA